MEEGASALYRGVVPRVAKIAAGQCIVFLTYEHLREISDAALSAAATR